MLIQRLADSVMLSVPAVLGWAALTENQGWWFFLPLWWVIVAWLHFSGFSLPALRWRCVPGFLLFFLRQLVLGAFDVGWRALAVTPNFAPQWQRYPLRLTAPANQRLLASMISLLPGTCSAEIEQYQGKANQLLLHVLDQHADWQNGVAALEQQLGRLLAGETRRDNLK